MGIDVAFWFMEDARYSNELIKRFNAGVPVRVLMDPRANETYAPNASRLKELSDAGIPMRRRTAGGILHWKMMLFAGQNTVEFSAANYSPWAFVPVDPYVNYTDEVVYFTTQNSVVNSFRTKFDDLWTDTSSYRDYANITTAPVRNYDVFTKDPELNFSPRESFRSRAVRRYDAETAAIDVTMFRITDRAHADAMIRAEQRGVPVRLYTEPEQYRDVSRLWHSWNVDRMYMAGVDIRHRAHAGMNHQKSVTLHGQRMTIFGSSNWTSPSTDSQEEHNYFTYKTNFYQYFFDQFERKWNNSAGYAESKPFEPLPPHRPAYVLPADGSLAVPTDSVTLTWYAGPWAHLYDVYFGTTPEPPLFAENQPLGPSEHSNDYQKLIVTGLASGTTYYWRVVSKTMAQKMAAGPVYRFVTDGIAPPPPASGTLGPGDILLYASKASTAGSWRSVPDSLAAGGARMENPNAGLSKVVTASASPSDYFEMTFQAEAGKPYRLWMRLNAQKNHYANDSVLVQFSGAVNSGGSPIWRIGTTGSTDVNLEDCSNCGLSGWGWQDNGWGVGVLGPAIYFERSGEQRIRVQRREDGVSIDQILLSPGLYLDSAPGALKNDATILLESTVGGSGGGTEEPPPTETEEPPPTTGSDGEGNVVLQAATATVVGTAWRLTADTSAAGGTALENPNAGASKIVTAVASPASYVEFPFYAEANKAYRLWIRSRAANNSWANDSVHVQFSDSLDPAGAAAWRIGTSASTEVNLEDCSNCGLSGWGWQDNGWGVGVLGPMISFETTGTHTIRIQQREDGIRLDQIVLSPVQYVSAAPGPLKGDTTILAESDGTVTTTDGTTGEAEDGTIAPSDNEDEAVVPGETSDALVFAASSATITGGNWQVVADASAAGGAAMLNPNAGAAKITTALANPASYIELTFEAEANEAYRLWIRSRAASDRWSNDSVHVQFSDSLDPTGSAAWRIGTTESAEVNLEDCSNCGLSGWGWQDNGWGVGVLGPMIAFENSGTHTMRIQQREDGVRIDQIVLSAVTYATEAPGALTDDTTILPSGS